MIDIKTRIGKTDIYFLDLLLTNDFPRGAKVLDAGCGAGRNLACLLNPAFEVYGVDRDPASLALAQQRANRAGRASDESHFKCGEIEALDFPTRYFDLVICNAVLHFATDEDHFQAMVTELWRVLAPGGILFCRLASDIGIEDSVTLTSRGPQSRWRKLPDGSERFLVNLDFLKREQERIGAQQLGRIKTVNVEGLRCMSNWVLRKS